MRFGKPSSARDLAAEGGGVPLPPVAALLAFVLWLGVRGDETSTRGCTGGGEGACVTTRVGTVEGACVCTAADGGAVIVA